MGTGTNGTDFMEEKRYDSRERRVVPGRRNGIRRLAPVIIPRQLESTAAHMECLCRVWLRLTLTATLRSLNFTEFWYKE